MVQSVLYVNPVIYKDTGAGSATAPFKTLTRNFLGNSGTIELAAGTFRAAVSEFLEGDVVPSAISDAGAGTGVTGEGLGSWSGNSQLLQFYGDRDTIPAYAKLALTAATMADDIIFFPRGDPRYNQRGHIELLSEYRALI